MDLFKKNMAILNSRSPEVANVVGNIRPVGELRLFESVSGLPTLQVFDGNATGIFLHSPVDPIGEARELVKDQKFDRTDATVLFGFGLGYVASEIVETMDEGHDLFIIESRPDLFKCALQCRDLTAVFKNEKTHIFLGADSLQIIESLKSVGYKAFTGSIRKLAYAPAVKLASQEYSTIEDDISHFVGGLQSGVGTFIEQREKLIRNFFSNLSVVIHSRSAYELQGKLTGTPCLVVAAGPSLDRNIDEINRVKGKGVIISVDTAFQALLRRNITPDIVVTVDPNEANAQKIQKVNPDKIRDVHLVFRPDCNPETVEAFLGPKYYVNTGTSLFNWILDKVGRLPTFPYMLNVGHLGFFLARYLGADPIVMVGFDYAFTENRGHARDAGETWKPNFEKGRFVEIADTEGGKVKSVPAFVQMIRLLEREIRETKATCINATEGGALIRGAVVMKLADAIEKYMVPTSKKLELSSRGAINADIGEKKLFEAMEWFDKQCNVAEKQSVQGERLIAACQQNLSVCTETDNVEACRRELQEIKIVRSMIVGMRTWWDVMKDVLSTLHIAEMKRELGQFGRLPNVHNELESASDFFFEVKQAIDVIRKNSRSYLSSFSNGSSEEGGLSRSIKRECG